MKTKVIDLKKYIPQLDPIQLFDDFELLTEYEYLLTRIFAVNPLHFNYNNLKDPSKFIKKMEKIIYFAYYERSISLILRGAVTSISFTLNNNSSIIMEISYSHKKNFNDILILRKRYSTLNIVISLESDQQKVNMCFKSEYFSNFITQGEKLSDIKERPAYIK